MINRCKDSQTSTNMISDDILLIEEEQSIKVVLTILNNEVKLIDDEIQVSKYSDL